MESKNTVSSWEDWIMQLITFKNWDELFWIDIFKTLEIIRVPEKIKRPPLIPEIVEWLISLRGSVIPVLNFRKRMWSTDKEITKDTKIVIANISGMVLWLLVDRTPEIYRIPNSQIEKPESVLTWDESNCVNLIWKYNDKLVQILDLDKIIPNEILDKISKLKEK